MVWVVATGVVIEQWEGQFHSSSIYADPSCVGIIGSGSDVWVCSHSHRCPRFSVGDESGSDVWVRSHSHRCACFSGGVESVAAMSECARTPVAVHAWIWGVTSLWQRHVGALALPSLSTLGSGG